MKVEMADGRKIRCPRCGAMVRWQYRVGHECFKETLVGIEIRLSGMERAEAVPKRRSVVSRLGF